MVNNTFCSVTEKKLLYNDIWYYANYLKYTNNILQFFQYLLFYMKPDMISIIISNKYYIHDCRQCTTKCFMDVLKDSHIYKTHPKFNNANKIHVVI